MVRWLISAIAYKTINRLLVVSQQVELDALHFTSCKREQDGERLTVSVSEVAFGLTFAMRLPALLTSA